MLAGVHQVGQLGPARTQLFGDLAPGFPGMGAVWLVEGLPDRGGNDRVLAARDMGQRVAHPVNAAALPSGLEHAGDGGLASRANLAQFPDEELWPLKWLLTGG